MRSREDDLDRQNTLLIQLSCKWSFARAYCCYFKGSTTPGGGGGVLWYFHIFIHRLGPFLGGSKIWISIYFWVFRKMIFLGVWWFCGYFLGSSQNWASLRLISMHFRVFFKVKVQNWDIFLGLLNYQLFFWGAWNSWYFLWVNGRCWVRAYVYRKKLEYPPSPWVHTPVQTCIFLSRCLYYSF